MRNLLRDIRRTQIRLLAALHGPGEPVEAERPVAMDDEAADVEDGAFLHGRIVVRREIRWLLLLSVTPWTYLKRLEGTRHL